ncbi:MAG: phosphoribosylamine--glycine ligase, partial [Dehalococcoidales bacterium]|nr:phosphoribosylamine--glycine ligase [Dehalococcoidales bacterium]
LKTDLVEIILAVVNDSLDKAKIEFEDDACVGVVMASAGYPGSYRTGFAVRGLDEVDKDVTVFHAGTKLGDRGEILTSGGRVLTVVAKGKDLGEAREKVYRNISRISFEGAYYRRDIAAVRIE